MIKFDFDFETQQKQKVYGIGRLPDSHSENIPLQAISISVHGFGEHCQRYEHVAEFLTQKNIGWIGFDLLGHGKSEGKRGHISNIQDFMEQIQLILALVTEKFPKIPLFLYGHSMGGNLVAHFLITQKPTYLTGAILTSPWFRLAFEPPAWKVQLGKLMVKIFPKYTEKSTLVVEELSTDPNIAQKYENDNLVHDLITASLFHEITTSGELSIQNAQNCQLPMLVMHGTADKITSFEATQEFVKQAQNERLTFKAWEGLRHELHNELLKNEILGVIANFIENTSKINN